MSDEVRDVNEGTGTQEQQNLPDEDRAKREIAGLNRKVTEMTNNLSELMKQNETLNLSLSEYREKEKASMSEVDKKELELKELNDKVTKLTQSLTDIETQKKESTLKAYKLEKLGESGVDSSFAKFINGADEAEIDNSITALKETLKAQQVELKQKIMDQSSPLKGVKDSGNVTQEQFNAMKYHERLELYNTDPETFRKYNKI